MLICLLPLAVGALGLIIFGPGKLPETGKAMGKTVREFRQATEAQFKEEQEMKESKDQLPQMQTQKS